MKKNKAFELKTFMIILFFIMITIFMFTKCIKPIVNENDKPKEHEYEEWHGIQTIDSAGDVGRYTSLAVEGSNIYISYCYDTDPDDALKFAKSTDSGVTWKASNIKTVEQKQWVGKYTSIAVDGKIFISATLVSHLANIVVTSFSH